jgi:hypothetical protein
LKSVKFQDEVNQEAQIQINSMLNDEIECKKKKTKLQNLTKNIYIYISKE